MPHIKFFEAGTKFHERCILAANRIGKSEGIGGYEVTLHATGLYPEWWTGRRFDRPVMIWVCGKTGQTVRDILQKKLLGPPNDKGTGLIRGDLIARTRPKAGGVPDAVETAYIKHISGGQSIIGFKSYAEGRGSFEGTEQDVVWCDEEPPLDVYGECLVRLMTNNGLMLCTFTPLEGMSETVMSFLPDGKLPSGGSGAVSGSKFVIMATWDDAPHLTKEQKERLWASTPPYQRDARSKGIPALGSGAIYPILQENIECDDIPIPIWWPKMYALDVGWNWTAALWGAYDKESDVIYLYSAYKRAKAEPAVHTEAIKRRGEWIPGAIDPASQGSSQIDGRKLVDIYVELGLNLFYAPNAVEAGIFEVWNRLSTGRLKIFKSLLPWFDEFRLYRRDDKGRIVKINDHLMDDTRYLCMSIDMAEEQPSDPDFDVYDINTQHDPTAGWY